MSGKTILVTAATGNVGSHVASLLLEQGFRVNALVRNPSSEAAQKLQEQGAALFKGDFDDIPSIEAAAEGVYGVFVNGNPAMMNMDGYRHNSNVITAARNAGAKLGVYMSAIMADRKDEFPGYGPEYPTYNYWEAKARAEKTLQEAGFDHWTIIRPAMFLTNFFGPVANYIWPHLQKDHALVYPTPNPQTIFPLIDPLDIGKFCAAPFSDPQTFGQRSIDLVTENVTLSQFAEKITRIIGIPIKVEYVSQEEAEERGITQLTNQWEGPRNSISYVVNREESLPVKLGSIESYLERNKDQIIKFLSK